MIVKNSIMIIDDDADDRMIFNESVNKASDEIMFEEASSGKEGLNKLQAAEKLPEFLFVDVNMPDMSGFEVLMKVRAVERFKEIKVIIYTTSNQRSAVETARHLGANGFLTKPDDMESLTVFIKKLLGAGQSAQFIEYGLLFMLLSSGMAILNSVKIVEYFP